MATGVRNRVAGGGGFGSGEHTHVHKEEKGDKARPGCPCELPWAEDTDQRTPVGGGGEGVFKDLHEVPEHYQMEMVFLKRAPGVHRPTQCAAGTQEQHPTGSQAPVGLRC